MTTSNVSRRRSLWAYLADHARLTCSGRETPSEAKLRIMVGTLPGVVIHVCPDCWPGTDAANVRDWHCDKHALPGGKHDVA